MLAPRKWNALVEARRRLGTLTLTVPALLNRHLRNVLGRDRWTFIAGLFRQAGHYRRAFARADDDAGLREVKKTFLLVGVLYQELLRIRGREVALSVTQDFLYDLACSVQRKAYFPPSGQPRTWDFLHDAHEAQMENGFIRANENGGIRRSERNVALEITRCRFQECFRDMGNAEITLAFCRSDETVFNEYSPIMRFHRGPSPVNTIARGAPRCTFIYERVAA